MHEETAHAEEQWKEVPHFGYEYWHWYSYKKRKRFKRNELLELKFQISNFRFSTSESTHRENLSKEREVLAWTHFLKHFLICGTTLELL